MLNDAAFRKMFSSKACAECGAPATRMRAVSVSDVHSDPLDEVGRFVCDAHAGVADNDLDTH